MNSSPSIATLAAALVDAQKEFSPAVKAKANPAFKGSLYVDLASAIDAAQPALLKHGIAVLQGASGDVAQQSVTITTRILHSSGEWIEDALTLPAVNHTGFTAQSAGSAITYARRYSYMAILGFAPEDDDGNAASATNGAVKSNGHQPTLAQIVLPKLITAEQAEAFRTACLETGYSQDAVKKALESKGIKSSARIPASDYKMWMEWALATAEVPA